MPYGRGSHRIIKGLEWTVPALKGPWGNKTPPRRGIKGQGHTYEGKLAKKLGVEWLHGQWFQFGDLSGPGWCQPDFLLIQPNFVVLLECKLSWTPIGHLQMSELYEPILIEHFKLPILKIQVCKNLTKQTPWNSITPDLPNAIELAAKNQPSVWHWLPNS